MKKEKLTKENLLWFFKYDKENGKLYWKNHWCKYHQRFVGREAGYVQKDGNTNYKRVSINSKVYGAHRIIWLMEHNESPEYIDHIDGNGLNNKLSNLRVSHNRDNQNNRNSHRNGELVGAQWRKNQGFWTSQIRINKRRIHLGCFMTEEEAHLCYLMARQKYGV